MDRKLGGLTAALLTFGLLLSVSGCGKAREEARHVALDQIRRQVASDIDLEIHEDTVRVRYSGEEPVRYVVCGEATLHRPSEDPRMALNHSRQRFITRVSYQRSAWTEFAGREESPAFRADWARLCELGS